MNTPLRYVVLHHTGVADPHYDVMIENAPGSNLRTWRSPTWPLQNETPLAPLTDHRRDYLDYEGNVSGGRGSVSRVAAGACMALQSGDARLILQFDGGIGTWAVERVPNASTEWVARRVK